ATAARAAADNGDRVRPVIEIARRGGKVVASLGPRRLAPMDPLFAVDDFSMGLVFETDLAGRVVVQLHDPHVDQVAYAILTGLLATAIFALYTVPIGIALGLVLAVLLNQRLRAINVFRTMMSSTIAISAAVGALIWLLLFNPSLGLLNYVLSRVGIHGPEWL